jgi:hypothetical protein
MKAGKTEGLAMGDESAGKNPYSPSRAFAVKGICMIYETKRTLF